jgi:hypothetical protein
MRFIVTFVISLVGFFVLHYLQVSSIFAMAILAIVILIGVMYPLLQVLLWETNITKVEKFLLKNKKNPNFYIVYALANGLDEDVRKITDSLLQKYKQPSRQALYKIGAALYFKNMIVVRNEIEYVKSDAYRLYYQAILLIDEGDIEGANELIVKVPTKWMKNALLAEREKQLNHTTEAQSYAEKAKQESRGLQRYLLHKTYEREFNI